MKRAPSVEELERLNLIIREKDKIIAALRRQLAREELTHRELFRMMGERCGDTKCNGALNKQGVCTICGYDW